MGLHTHRRLHWITGLMLVASIAHSEPARQQQAVGEREITVSNRSLRGIDELYASPQSGSSWGQDRLGTDVLDPGGFVRLRLGRLRDCNFDLLAVYDDASREERRGVNVCRTRELVFDGMAATSPADPPGPTRSVTLVNGGNRPIQQFFLSPPDAPQWGPDRLAQALPVGEQRDVGFRGACSADVRVVYANRAAEERRGLDLCRTSTLTIAPGWTTEQAE